LPTFRPWADLFPADISSSGGLRRLPRVPQGVSSPILLETTLVKGFQSAKTIMADRNPEKAKKPDISRYCLSLDLGRIVFAATSSLRWLVPPP
jgi:hypothetical protein